MTQKLLSFSITNVDHHIAVAGHHEEAAELHRNAPAIFFSYGDYQKVNEHAPIAWG